MSRSMVHYVYYVILLYYSILLYSNILYYSIVYYSILQYNILCYAWKMGFVHIMQCMGICDTKSLWTTGMLGKMVLVTRQGCLGKRRWGLKTLQLHNCWMPLQILNIIMALEDDGDKGQQHVSKAL